MLFHTTARRGRSFGSGGGQLDTKTEYRLDYSRVTFALLFFVILIVSAFVGRWLQWDEGATAFLHLVEIAAGGLVGLFFGERLALNALR